MLKCDVPKNALDPRPEVPRKIAVVPPFVEADALRLELALERLNERVHARALVVKHERHRRVNDRRWPSATPDVRQDLLNLAPKRSDEELLHGWRDVVALQNLATKIDPTLFLL